MKHIFTLLFLTVTLFANIQPQITYNDQHQPLVVEYANGKTITYTYDEAGNITQIETPTQTISKTYDALGRLKSVTDDQGTTTYAYDAIGRQTQITYPNGVTTSYTYDSRNRVTKIEHKKSDGTILQSFAYTYDAVGNRTQVVENTGRTVTYTYNEVNQLTKEIVSNDPNGNNTTTTFTYDDVGNLVTKTIDGISESYSYNANDQLTAKGSVTYTYDPNGNLIDDGTNSYEYDSKNRLVKVTTPTQTIEYSYDANDNRIAKVINGDTTTYLIDTNTPFAQVITESKENGTEIHYTYGNDLLSDRTHTFLTDALGSTRGLVDSSGALTDSYAYTPYGKLSSHEGTSENSFLFTGEQLDPETGNYYLRARYYDPAITRFLNRDTYDGKLNDPLSQNHYLYAGGNPVMYVDHSGHCFSMGGLSNSIAVMGILAGGAITSLSILNNNRGKYDGNNIRIIILKYKVLDFFRVAYMDIILKAGLADTPRPLTHDEENKLLKEVERILNEGAYSEEDCAFLRRAREILVEIMNWRDKNQDPSDGEIYIRHFERIEWIKELIDAIDTVFEMGMCQ